MTKIEYLALCEARWNEIDELSGSTNLYDLEKDFVGIWQTLGRSVFEERVGERPDNHRKKKSANELGNNRSK